jgi:hypothetical protein
MQNTASPRIAQPVKYHSLELNSELAERAEQLQTSLEINFPRAETFPAGIVSDVFRQSEPKDAERCARAGQLRVAVGGLEGKSEHVHVTDSRYPSNTICPPMRRSALNFPRI